MDGKTGFVHLLKKINSEGNKEGKLLIRCIL